MPRPAKQLNDAAEAVALYETTQEICSRLDLDQVLTAIVGRARQLLNGDVGYLATADDEAQSLVMRAVDGIRSEGFRTAVLPYGDGLGGTVASTRAPISTADYLVDFSVSHVGWIDEVVDEEGMRAAVGVPVEFQGRLLAVLFVGRRNTHGFSPHQVTLLSSLGNSAAIAINNAQTHGRLAQAMTVVSPIPPGPPMSGRAIPFPVPPPTSPILPEQPAITQAAAPISGVQRALDKRTSDVKRT